MSIQIPEKPAQALASLHRAGIGAWVVGGAVRDSLMGRPAADWDLTVACLPQHLQAALPEAKPIGGVYGTVSWHGVEITPCRAESGYSDHRHPDEIQFGTDIYADLARRDFTVNAIACDGKEIVDPYHGREDLQNRLLRCVGDPEVRFGEDALRILRLYRFAGVLDFAVEPVTGAAARKLAPTLGTVSAQRIKNELNKALAGPRPSALAPLVEAAGLEAFGVPARGERLTALDAVPADLLCRWWALLHLTGADPKQAAEIFDFGRNFMRDYARLDALYAAGCPQDIHSLKLLLMEGAPCTAGQACETFAALDEAWADVPALFAALEASGEPYMKAHLRITPAEMLVLGVPNRKIGNIQKALLKAVIDTPALNVYPTLAQMAKGLKKVF